MIARMLPAARCRPVILLGSLFLGLGTAGCQGLGKSHEAKHIPQLGIIDPHQAAELRKVTLPSYVIEAPDELEIATRPAISTWPSTTYVVQSDGTVDLGFWGDVFVSGLTLAEAEGKIAQHVNSRRRMLEPGVDAGTPYQVSVRLSNGQSKYYYVIGTVTTPGRFKVLGSETVLDAIVQAGLRTNSLPEKSYLVRPHPLGGPDQVFKIDWFGIKDRGDTLTNYQLMPGDRVVVPGTRPPSLIRSLLGS
jgi:polysaccharide export outer membrane protein